MNELVTNKKKWELVYDHVMNLNYGDVFLHQEVSHIINEPYLSGRYQAAITRAKKSLLIQGKDIESVRGRGYRVVDPDAYSEKSVATFKQGFSRLKKASDLLTYAPINHMTDEGRKVHRDVTDRARLLYASVAGGCTELNLLAKKPSAYLPENVSRR